MLGQHAVIFPRCSASVGVVCRSQVSLPAFACLHKKDTTSEGEFQCQLHQARIVDS
jgi:hypothetical protein